jgi:hypothetical protein
MPLRSNHIIAFALLALIGVSSCWGWEEPQQEVKEAITVEEEETPPAVREDYEELKDIMASASRHMKRLEGSLGGDNWATARDSAKRLEDLIGRRCVNSYVKAHKDVPQDFVRISQRFNDAVLRLLVAERHQDSSLAKGQFQLMQEGCEECHQKYRKERGL